MEDGVQYEEFVAQYKRTHRDWGSGIIDTAAAAAEIARLRSILPVLEPSAKRASAEYALDQFADEISPESQDRMARAVTAIAVASAEDGTVEERLARAEEDLRAVTRIADETSNDDERHAILSMNEMLGMLIMSLRDTSDGR